jgi:sarcosine oxidase subunit delta
MKIMVCPLNGPRNITEFACGGDVKPVPDPAACSDAEWTDYLFIEDNTAGVVDEWWLHTPSNTWFIARRNTLTDEILATMTVADYFDRRPSGVDAAGMGGAA